MTLLGRCCICGEEPPPPGPLIQGRFHRILRCYPDPSWDGGPATRWDKVFDQDDGWSGEGLYWAQGWYNFSLQEWQAGRPVPVIKLQTLIYEPDYPDQNGGDWSRADWTGLNTNNFNDGPYFPSYQTGNEFWRERTEDQATIWGPSVMQQSAAHTVNGAFATNSHITYDQWIGGLQDVDAAMNPWVLPGNALHFGNMGFFIGVGGPSEVKGPRMRIRRIGMIHNGNYLPMQDVIPPEQQHTLWPEYQYAPNGGPYTTVEEKLWRHNENIRNLGYYDVLLTRHRSRLTFDLNQAYGYWPWTTLSQFKGGVIGWRVEWEIQMQPNYFDGGVTDYFLSTKVEMRPLGYYSMHLNVLEDWDKNTQDWELTFTGGDAPPPPYNTVRISELHRGTLADYGASGVIQKGDWPDVRYSKWSETELWVNIQWDKEVVNITLDSVYEELGPYRTAAENYMSNGPADIEVIDHWYDSNKPEWNHYDSFTPRGTWVGEINGIQPPQQFIKALNADRGDNEWPERRLTGEWPTECTLRRIYPE